MCARIYKCALSVYIHTHRHSHSSSDVGSSCAKVSRAIFCPSGMQEVSQTEVFRTCVVMQNLHRPNVELTIKNPPSRTCFAFLIHARICTDLGELVKTRRLQALFHREVVGFRLHAGSCGPFCGRIVQDHLAHRVISTWSKEHFTP